MRVLGDTASFQMGLFTTNNLDLMNCYKNVYRDELLYECICWINIMLYDVAHRWWILWNYNVESLLVLLLSLSLMSSSRWCCTLLWISCWVHAYSYKVGGSCPVECLIIQTTLILRAYAQHVDLGVDAPQVVLRAIALHVEMRAYALTRWLVPHAYCIVKLLLCLCIVASSSSCCDIFKCQVEIIEQYVKFYYFLVKVVYVVKFHWWIICLLLLNVKSHPFCLNVASTWVTCR